MLALFITSLTIITVSVIVFSLLIIRQVKISAQDEAARLLCLSEMALAHLKAKTLAEITASHSQKEADSLQLAYLKKTLAKQEDQTKEKAKAQEPVLAKTDDGAEVDLRDYEVFS